MVVIIFWQISSSLRLIIPEFVWRTYALEVLALSEGVLATIPFKASEG